MRCTMPDCDEAPAARGDVFCATHWRALPKWARSELVTLRNLAGRGAQAARRDFGRAVMVAAHLLAKAAAPVAPAAAGETPPVQPRPSTSE